MRECPPTATPPTPAPPNTGSGALRFPQSRPFRQPVHGVQNIRRDVDLVRRGFAGQPPRLVVSGSRARQAQLADNVEELDDRILEVIVAAEHELVAAGADRGDIWADVIHARAAEGPLPQLGPALERALELDTIHDRPLAYIELIVAATETLSRIRTAFPDLTTRHNG